MKWQDVLFAAGSVIFSIALVPMLMSEAKPPLRTSVPTGVILLLFAAAYGTLGLVLAAITSWISGIIWLVLAGQAAYNNLATRA